MTDDRPLSGTERNALLKAATDEHNAWKAARLLGTPLPSTPNLDKLNQIKAQEAEAMSATKTATKRAPKADRAPVQFFVNGEPVSAARNTLPVIAWNYTAGVQSKNSKRIPVKDFRDMLINEFKISDPDAPWGKSVKLANGNTIECKPFDASIAKKAPAKKAPAKAAVKSTKKAPAKKAPAKKASAQKQVTPIPKKAALKK